MTGLLGGTEKNESRKVDTSREGLVCEIQKKLLKKYAQDIQQALTEIEKIIGLSPHC